MSLAASVTLRRRNSIFPALALLSRSKCRASDIVARRWAYKAIPDQRREGDLHASVSCRCVRNSHSRREIATHDARFRGRGHSDRPFRAIPSAGRRTRRTPARTARQGTIGCLRHPDADWGEVVVAFIVGTVNPAELDAHLLERIARFKRPKRYVFVDELPKTATARCSNGNCAPGWRDAHAHVDQPANRNSDTTITKVPARRIGRYQHQFGLSPLH